MNDDFAVARSIKGPRFWHFSPGESDLPYTRVICFGMVNTVVCKAHTDRC